MHIRSAQWSILNNKLCYFRHLYSFGMIAFAQRDEQYFDSILVIYKIDFKVSRLVFKIARNTVRISEQIYLRQTILSTYGVKPLLF